MASIPIRLLGCAGCIGLVLATGCRATRKVTSNYPPADFKLALRYTVGTGNGDTVQVKRHALVFANGWVILREADRTLRSKSGAIELPLFQRMCVYRLDWRSIRSLSREIARQQAKDLVQPMHAPARDEVHTVELDLTYAGNKVDVVLQDRAIGLLNGIMRTVDSFLPDGHGFSFQSSAGEPEPSRIQDVPPVKDSIQGALGYHQAWLLDTPGDVALLRDTFALACAARDWAVAESCLGRLVDLQSQGPLRSDLTEILQAAKAQAGVPSR